MIDIDQEWGRLDNIKGLFDFRDFSNLDASENGEYLIQSMYELYELPGIQSIKNRAINLLELKKGDSAIELGCGLGHDLEAISRLVGNTGSVLGIDKSNLMLQEARRRLGKYNIQLKNMDVAELDCPSNSFSVSYADRLLVSQVRVDKVLDELVRIVKPSGKICITDIDMGSIVLFPYREKLTEQLKERLRNIVVNPFIGRRLHHEFRQRGLIDIKVFSEAYTVSSFKTVNKMIDYPRIIHDLYKMHVYSKDAAVTLLKDFYEAEKNGTFLYSIILFTVVGTKK
ncbi:MAG: hypothetical protein A2103_05375 [Gammaproteobacteria bacterium GWF2_41_13]|nr:MAG: hypothetical protein A2103_05375 [Gammaproteobacteria bacterium GWF2_41_13]